MIDLHTHTTASDGRCTAAELVARAAAAGVTVLSVTDHDTVIGCAAAADECAARRMTFVPGIEISAIRDDVDVHVLGYFLDPVSPDLLQFLLAQRQLRIGRVREMVKRLGALGIAVDAEAIVRPALVDPSKSAGRPWIARALVEAGYVRSVSEAFGLWLGRGKPAYVPRQSGSPEEIIARIHAAGGLASLAHPGLLAHDEWIESFVDAGLDALEVYHSEHDPEQTLRYRKRAEDLRLATSGGSDYHGDAAHGAVEPGAATLPAEDFDRLAALSRQRRRRMDSSGL